MAIEWKHEKRNVVHRMLVRSTSIYPFEYGNVIVEHDFYTAKLGPYLVCIQAGDLGHTARVFLKDDSVMLFALDVFGMGLPEAEFFCADLMDAQMRALLWISTEAAKVTNEAALEWARMSGQWDVDKIRKIQSEIIAADYFDEALYQNSREVAVKE